MCEASHVGHILESAFELAHQRTGTRRPRSCWAKRGVHTERQQHSDQNRSREHLASDFRRKLANTLQPSSNTRGFGKSHVHMSGIRFGEHVWDAAAMLCRPVAKLMEIVGRARSVIKQIEDGAQADCWSEEMGRDGVIGDTLLPDVKERNKCTQSHNYPQQTVLSGRRSIQLKTVVSNKRCTSHPRHKLSTPIIHRGNSPTFLVWVVRRYPDPGHFFMLFFQPCSMGQNRVPVIHQVFRLSSGTRFNIDRTHFLTWSR